MTKQEFLRQLEEDLEITSVTLSPETKIEEIEEWDSLASMTAVSIIDDHFGLDFEMSRMNNISSIKEIFEIIGQENFEDE